MTVIQLIICLTTVSFLIIFQTYFLIKMSRLHQFEFKKHLKKYLILSLSFIILLLMETVVAVETFLIGASNQAVDKFFDNLWNWAIFSSVVELAPYLVFLIVNTVYKPHDCFRCFGKDPERKFSIYQYTQDERKEIERNKRGKGALYSEA